MKPVHQRKAMSLKIDIEALMSMLERDGYPSLPEDGRLLGARIDPSSLFICIDIESDSISDDFAMTHGLTSPRRVSVALDRKDSP